MDVTNINVCNANFCAFVLPLSYPCHILRRAVCLQDHVEKGEMTAETQSKIINQTGKSCGGQAPSAYAMCDTEASAEVCKSKLAATHSGSEDDRAI
jgi:hypothetical protein